MLNFSLIVCTYMRPKALCRLLDSVQMQSCYPNEILIVDGSTDERTELALQQKNYPALRYHKVKPHERGLTKQRNLGISLVNQSSAIICFLDDDTLLELDYFENILKVFSQNQDVVGVGGVAVNENRWEKKDISFKNRMFYYQWEGFYIRESSRNLVRKLIGLQSDKAPGVMPEFSHGRTYSYPLTGKIYEVDLLVGMSMSFRKKIFDQLKFSTYFEGYGLYEDADFSLRARAYGKLVIATSAKLKHLHEASGRPNHYKYGKMVVRNGWYVWRVAYPKPSVKARVKWHAISLLLSLIRLSNVVTTNRPKAAFTEAMGRVVGWWSILFNKPVIQR